MRSGSSPRVQRCRAEAVPASDHYRDVLTIFVVLEAGHADRPMIRFLSSIKTKR